MTATADELAALRVPFPPECVGKLPRVTNKEGTKSKCSVCGGYLAPHIHLDFVGHAEVTDRLLSVDPLWSWEPMAFTDDGRPMVAKGAGGDWTLWVRLTVLGVARLGVGSVAAGAFDVEKQLIGDALRNAAMRFGVALDLWAKEELESTVTGEVAGGGEPAPAGPAVAPASTRRPPPRRTGAEAPTQKEVANLTSLPQSETVQVPAGGGRSPDAVPPATITPAALDSILTFAARKGIDGVRLIAMAGKPLEQLTEPESQALTGLVAKAPKVETTV